MFVFSPDTSMQKSTVAASIIIEFSFGRQYFSLFRANKS